jgi:hypothetical protein
MAKQSMSSPETRILHLHIEKTGGTALRFGLERALGPGARIFHRLHEAKLEGIEPDQWDLITGHFGYARLAPLGGRVVVLLRDPVDRMMSAYYYWREMQATGAFTSRQTVLATQYSFDDFVTIRDEVSLVDQFFNHMTWQLADTYRLALRHDLRARGVTDAELLALAVEHLRECVVVGVQERMEAFTAQFERRIGLPLSVDRLNVTTRRPAMSELSARTRARVVEWVYLDVELYQAACALAAAR